jgi:hypothetical protein
VVYFVSMIASACGDIDCCMRLVVNLHNHKNEGLNDRSAILSNFHFNLNSHMSHKIALFANELAKKM